MCRTQNVVSQSQFFRLDLKPQDLCTARDRWLRPPRGTRPQFTRNRVLHISMLTKPRGLKLGTSLWLVRRSLQQLRELQCPLLYGNSGPKDTPVTGPVPPSQVYVLSPLSPLPFHTLDV